MLAISGFSQQDSVLKNKKGKPVLPEKGDFALGISANPIFNFVGNMFSSSGSNQLYLNFLNGQVYGKYFTSSQSALRLKLGIYNSTSHYENNVEDDYNINHKVTDEMDYSYNSISFAAGIEKRKGSGRLQVSYGGELLLSLYSYSNKYSYGNAFSVTNTSPTTTYDFYNSYSYKTSTRPLESKRNDGLTTGLRAFTGIEYFVFPKISVGGEIGLGYRHAFGGKKTTKTEYWDFVNSILKSDDLENNYRYSSLYTDILNGQIFILFHF
jgi:hypothetical protein